MFAINFHSAFQRHARCRPASAKVGKPICAIEHATIWIGGSEAPPFGRATAGGAVADAQLQAIRAIEIANIQNFEMIKQSLPDEIKFEGCPRPICVQAPER